MQARTNRCLPNSKFAFSSELYRDRDPGHNHDRIAFQMAAMGASS